MRNQSLELSSNISTAVFLVGQDAAGHWLAKASSGVCGGLFVNRDAALHYALAESGFCNDRIAVVDDEMTLDL